MRKLIIIVTLLVFKVCFSQTKISEEKKAESLIRIWGLLKYHHPEVSKGSYNFNQEFITEFNKTQTIVNQGDLNDEFVSWIKKLDADKPKYKSNPDFLTTKKLFTRNADFDWITNSGFSPELTQLLIKVRENSNYGNYYASVNSFSGMVEFKNEKGFDNFDSSLLSNRMLFLASFWNTMRYWNVNIYLTETPWSTVLNVMIPDFISDDKTTYELAKDKLFSKLNDSHSNYNSSYLFRDSSTKISLYGGRIVNDSLIIRSVFNKELAKKNTISLGDIIYSINGKKLGDFCRDKFSERVSASNENYLKSALEKYYLLSDTADSLKVGILQKDGLTAEKYIHLYSRSEYKYEPETLDSPKTIQWQKLTDAIGYINLKEINKSDLKMAFKAFKNTKGIVIDLRNYPQNLNKSDVPSFLYPEKKTFMKVLAPFAPSYGQYEAQSILKIVGDPFSAGYSNNDFYKGKICLLVDRTTASMAEYFAMAIQQSPNCITIGEQTFGAVMNRNKVVLIDKTTIDFTGMGAFYPNDQNVQRKGLKIDYLVKENALNYNENHYIEEAINAIQGK